MEGASADASSGPEPLLSGEGIDQEPVVPLEPEHIERVGQRVHEPQVPHLFPGVDAQLTMAGIRNPLHSKYTPLEKEVET